MTALCLHLCDLRVGNSQTAATVTHHRVELMQGVDNVLDRLNGLVAVRQPASRYPPPQSVRTHEAADPGNGS